MTLAAAGVTVTIGERDLISDASLSLEPGELIAIVGPNGAGKTTLLRTLAGDLRPTGGAIALDGRPIDEWDGSELARRRAVMAGDGHVAFGFTAAEVVMLGRMPHHAGRPTDADRAVVERLIAAVDAAAYAGRVYATLSTGERQRIRLARTLAQIAPSDGGIAADDRSDAGRYLLLDEPTSNLDPAHQHVAMGLARREADAGIGIGVVLHDLALAAAYADRIVLIDRGRIVADAPPDDVLTADTLSPAFGIPMLVLRSPEVDHPLVVAKPPGASGERPDRVAR